MKKNKIKFIASDLDGTLLLNGAQKVSEELIPLIKRLNDEGIIFCAASGRQYPNLRRLFGEEAERLRKAGGEYGASTGRPRRVGPIDLVATRYGCRIQGATEVALTQLGVLSYMKEIPVCTQYEVNGEKTDDFPFTAVIDEATPVLTTVPGWGCDISGVRAWADMPQAARDYVEYAEQAIGCHIGYVSVGAERESLIVR